MPTDRRALPRAVLAIAAMLLAHAGVADLRVSEGTNFSADVSPRREALAIDLLGSLWLLPTRGGDARRLTDQLLPVSRPRWSPDGERILYQSDAQAGTALWYVDVETGERTQLTDTGNVDQQGAWHPDGKRIVFASARDDSGLDVWEMDLATGLEWRVTQHAGDETEPAWSENGRHLCYILHEDGAWKLMLRRFAQPPVTLARSDTPLYAPSWRPDGTLITFLQRMADGLVLRMAILSDPPLVRTLAERQDFFTAPVSWLDRKTFFFTADGTVKVRGFDERRATPLHFSAAVADRGYRNTGTQASRALPAPATKGGDLVLRAPRLYDGVSNDYRQNVDVLIAGGRITAIEDQRDRGDAIVVDIGDVTILPGLIDVYAGLPAAMDAASGARLLGFGVTTLVSPYATGIPHAVDWTDAATPGPRVLPAATLDSATPAHDEATTWLLSLTGENASDSGLRDRIRDWQDAGVPVLASNWSVGLGAGAGLLLGAATLPSSPRGVRYQDVHLITGGGPLTLVSALADAATPGLEALLGARPAAAPAAMARRRYVEPLELAGGAPSVVVGSLPSGLPPGVATQAELLALQAAGLPAAQVLHAATGAAADALGLSAEIGHVIPGARADLLLVTGDPLRDAADAANVVGIVRNGHFHSLTGLLEQAGVD